MRDINKTTITDAAIASISKTNDPRPQGRVVDKCDP